MGKLKENWNKNKFSIYDSEEKTTLKIIENVTKFVGDDVITELDNKTDINGDHKGSWQGLSKPTLAQEGISALVEKMANEQIPIVNVKSSGALGNGENDDYSNIQRLIDKMHIEGGGTIFFPTGKYLISRTLKFYDNVTFEFETGNKDFSYLGPTINGVYIKNYLILINSLDGITPYKNVSSKSSDNKEYKGLSINNFIDMNNSKNVIITNLKGVFLAQANCQFNRITSMGLSNTVVLDPLSYLDNIVFENCLFMGVNDYAILKEGNGECLTIKNCKVYESITNGGINWKLVKAKNTLNLKIENLINGVIDITDSTFEIDNIHIEKGYININNSNGSIRDFTIYHTLEGQAPILLKNNFKYGVTVENGDFMLTPFEHPNAETTYNFDIYAICGYLKIRNLRRTIVFDLSNYSSTGIKIDSTDTNFKNKFNKNSSQYSNECTIVGGGIETKAFHFNEMVNGGGIIFVNVDTSNPYNWHNIETDLYYTCQFIFNDDKYLMGCSMTNEVSVHAKNKPISITVNNGWKCKNAMLRIWRGTSAGNYSSYVDIPYFGLESAIYGIIDTGTQVNGYPWIYSNATLETLSTQRDNNIKSFEYKSSSDNSIIELTVTGVPLSTHFKKGDRAVSINENKTYYFDGTRWI